MGLALPCLRVAALHDQAKWVQGVLWASFFLTYVIVLVLLGFAYTTWKTITESPLTHMCLPATVPSHMYGAYLVPMAFDVLVIVLTVIKARENSVDLRSGSSTPIVCRVAQVHRSRGFSLYLPALHFDSGWCLVCHDFCLTHRPFIDTDICVCSHFLNIVCHICSHYFQLISIRSYCVLAT